MGKSSAFAPALRSFGGEGLRAHLLRGGAGSLLVKAGHGVLAFGVAVVLARVLGPEGYGVYAFALAILMLIAIPAQVGIPQLAVRETAKAQANQDWGLMRGLWRWGNISVAVFSTLGVVAASAVIFLLETRETDRTVTISIGIALIPLIALTNVRAACLRGLRMVVLGQLPEIILRPALLLILLGGWTMILRNTPALTASGAMAMQVFASLATLLIASLMLGKAQPEGVKSRPSPRYEAVAWRKAVIPLAMIGGLQLINQHADLIILGLLRPDEEVGVYRAVFQVALLVIFGLQAMNQVLQPHFARLYSQGDMTKLQQLVTTSARAILALAMPPVLILMVFGTELLGWVFGDAFQAGGVALAILAAGQLINAGVGSVGALLNMTGNERYTMLGVAVAAASNVGMNLLLIPFLGMVGAAIASAFALVLWNLLSMYFVRKQLAIAASALGPRGA